MSAPITKTVIIKIGQGLTVTIEGLVIWVDKIEPEVQRVIIETAHANIGESWCAPSSQGGE